MSNRVRAISIFSGPAGSTQGMKDAGVEDVIGVEWDADAVATARAAGHTVIHDDVRLVTPRSVFERLIPADLRHTIKLLLQGSPPCQGLSLAGKGKGREDIEHLLDAIAGLSQESGLATTWDDAQALIPSLMQSLTDMCSDDRSPLTFEVMRWIFDLSPDFIMLEQVPAALPIFEAIGAVLESWGWSVWVGCVQAEQFGVPQTRKRAKLLAKAVGKVEAPTPTHSKYHSRTPERLDDGVLPWVSMAEALGWGVEELVGFPRRYDGRGEAIEMDGELYRGRDFRKGADPSFVVTEKARSWQRYVEKAAFVCTNVRPNSAVRLLDQPAPTLAFGHETPNWLDSEHPAVHKVLDKTALLTEVEPRVHNQSGTEFDLTWPADRPAPVIAGRDIVTMPGANANRFNGSTKSRNDGIKVADWEAGVLQSFPKDYPWQGTKTKRFQQIGNAVPPLLQTALTLHLLGK